jgi:predicted ATPase/class 3 adenylate cyclase/DNA-binding CsgD family transcriptional regulator
MGEHNEAHALSRLSDYRAPIGLAEVAVGATAGSGLPIGTVTFLLTDIEGSTRAWERPGTEMAAAVARHYEILDAAVTRHGGVRPLEQGEGDSLVAAFSSASDAVAAALEGQQALTEEDWPAGAEITVRMALHTGDAQIRDERFYVGPSIIRCARIRALGHGGQVLISSTTADLLADRLPKGAALLPLGLHRLRDLRQPERIFQLSHSALCSQFPPLRSLDLLPNNLPVQLTSFIGRELELADIAARLAEHRLVTLVGAGGCGKTRLAAQAAAEIAEGYPAGAWWIDLASVHDPAALSQAVMNSLGLLDARGMDPVGRITRYLAGQRALLVFDNCEHVLEATARVIDAVLRLCPEVSAVATSREPLGVPGELAWRVPALTMPDNPDQAPGEMVLASEAVRLFVDRAGEARPTFRLDAANAATVAAVCIRLDGLPLAIELAAARVRSLSPERILDGLSDRFRLLTGGARTAVARQQTLQASVEWSYSLLKEGEQVLLRRLGAFPRTFTLEAAEVVCAGDPLEGWEVLTLLSDLVDKSLVLFDGSRYRLLQTIQDFANSQLLQAGEADMMRDRHADLFLDMAQSATAELERCPRPEVLDRLEADHDNFRTALQWTLSRDDAERAMQFVLALFLFWEGHGHFTEALGWYRKTLQVSGDRGARRATALANQALLSGFGMELPGGYGLAEATESVALAESLGDPAISLRAQMLLGGMLGFMSPADGVAALTAVVDTARRLDDTWTLGWSLFLTAFHHGVHQDRPDLAAPVLSELAEVAQRTGSPYWLAWHGVAASITPFRQGRLDESRRFLDRSLALAHQFDDPMLQSYAMVVRTMIPIAEGDYEAAAAIAAETREIQDRIGSLCRVEWFDIQLAEAFLAQGDVAAAQERIEGIEAVARSGGFPLVVQLLTVVKGQAAFDSGQLPAARISWEEAYAIGTQLECPWYMAEAGHRLGRLAQAEGDPAAAEDHQHRALALCVRHGFRGLAAAVLEGLASLAVAGEGFAEGARLFGAAQALREATGQRRWAPSQPAFDADLGLLRERLGAAALLEAWESGAALSLEAAAAYASRARGERKRPSRGWDALTPTELDVVALAAQGLTNAEIGRRLFISAGTAKIHLSHIYAKLGVANRAELAAQAAIRGSRPGVGATERGAVVR